MAEEKVEARKEVPPLKEMKISERQYKQQTYFAIADKGVVLEDVCKREYWKHVTPRRLQPSDKISVMCEDKSWYIELIVFATYGSAGADVMPLPGSFIRGGYGRAPEKPLPEFEIVDAGLAEKWSVRRVKDDHLMLTGYKTQEEAQGALRDWLKADGQKVA